MPIRQPDKSKLKKDASGSWWRRPRGNTPVIWVKQPEGTHPPYRRVKAVWDFQNGMWIEPTGIPDVTNTTMDATNDANEATNDDITEDVTNTTMESTAMRLRMLVTNEERQSKKFKTAGEMTGTISNNLTHCPVCMDWYRKEIFQCDKGHLICSECKESLTNNKCPTCRVDISNIRNRALEDLLETVARPCSFSTNGCKFIGVKADLIKHEKECDNMIMVCPEKGCNCTVSPNCMITHLINMHVHELLPEDKPKIYHFRQEIVFENKYPIVKFDLELPEENSTRTTLLQFGSHALFMLTFENLNNNSLLFSAKKIFEDTSRQFLRKSNKPKKEITELLKNSDQSPYTHISVEILGTPGNSILFPVPLTFINDNRKEFYIFDNTMNEYPYKTNDVRFPVSMFSEEILNVKNNRVSVSIRLQPGRKFCDWELSEVYQKTCHEWYEEAIVHKDKKEWQKCINSLHNCVFLDQEHKNAWFALGDAFYQKNKKFVEECYTPYSKCIELDSNNYPAKWNLSLVFEHVKVKRDLVAALKLVEDCEEANAKLINCDIKKRLRSLRNRITREKNIKKN